MAHPSLVLAYSRPAEGDLAAAAPPALRVGPSARWVQAPGSPRLELARRPVLRRVFVALLECYARDPSASLDAATLFRAGWPGEKATPESALNRVYVSLCRLRKLGLADYIATGPSGFRLTRGAASEGSGARPLPTLSGRERALIAAAVAAVKHACDDVGSRGAPGGSALDESIEIAEAIYARALADGA